MILDIRFVRKGPEQIQGVRTFTLYNTVTTDGLYGPELVIVFQDATRNPPRNIPMAAILDMRVSND